VLLRANEAKVNKVHSAHKPHEKTNDNQEVEAKEMVEEHPDPSPEEETGEQVGDDGKHRTFVFRGDDPPPLRESSRRESTWGSAFEERR